MRVFNKGVVTTLNSVRWCFPAENRIQFAPSVEKNPCATYPCSSRGKYPESHADTFREITHCFLGSPALKALHVADIYERGPLPGSLEPARQMLLKRYRYRRVEVRILVQYIRWKVQYDGRLSARMEIDEGLRLRCRNVLLYNTERSDYYECI